MYLTRYEWRKYILWAPWAVLVDNDVIMAISVPYHWEQQEVWFGFPLIIAIYGHRSENQFMRLPANQDETDSYINVVVPNSFLSLDSEDWA